MKKRNLIGLLLACLLLSGCGTGPSAPAETAATLPAEQETVPDSSGLRYVPNAIVEGMEDPGMYLYGNGLLFSEWADGSLHLALISLEDGSVTASGSVPAASGTTLCIGSGEVGLCDRGSGRVTVLDGSLRVLRTYTVSTQGDAWHLSPELDTLYIFFADRGLLVLDLASGEHRWLVDGGTHVECLGSGTGYVIFGYTDRETGQPFSRYLDLYTATMSTLPVSGSVSGGSRRGETWLLQSGEEDGLHMLVRDGSVYTFSFSGSLRLLASRSHLLAEDPDRRELTLYDSDGTFLSRCSAVLGSGPVWSGYRNGYFFTDVSSGTERLMFWDIDTGALGADLQMTLLGPAPEAETLVEPQLYARAEELSQRFGLDIRIGENCSPDYSHYDTQPLTDPVILRSALDTLERSLSRYPEGFFRQLPYGAIASIRVELVGGLTAKEGADTHPASVGAFTQDRGDHFAIVLDGYAILEKTLFHEFSHIIDARLEWTARHEEGRLFSEDAWLELQPQGFRYAMTYTHIPEETLLFMSSDSFIREYSMSFPSEDRADLMAAAMEGEIWAFGEGTGRRTKMRYYADCIRDCFDTEGWPETTLWEQVLN